MHHRKILVVLSFITLAAASFGFSAPIDMGTSNPALNVIYSFTNGVSPSAGLIQSANGHFHGATVTGGPGNFGGIYEVTSNGVLTNMIWLKGTDGAAPLAALIEDGSGNFYGTASSGGVKTNGTLFKITSGGQFQLLASFNNTNGATPMGPLLEGTNGWFYGTTFNGGSNGLGSIFRFNVALGISNVYSFSGTDGANPAAGLIQGRDGNLYGTTEYGGADGLGTVFKLSYAGALNNLCSFTEATGAFPGGLIEDTRGNFYGPTINGGTNFAGTIFKLSPGSVQTLDTFDITNGANPNPTLIEGSNGYWFGASEEGGAFGQGTIFLLNSKGFLADVFSFSGPDGALPRSGVIQGTDGMFYGTTSKGGAFGSGEIYQLIGFEPLIVAPPASQRYVSNSAAPFTVVTAGNPPPSYQWLFNGVPIPGATNASLNVSHEQLTNSGTYSVIVSNMYGAVTNSNAVLTVTAPTVSIVVPRPSVTNALLTISGTASDPNGIASVSCQLNSNGWVAASGTTHWQTNVILQPGTNTFQAQSFDPIGTPSTIRSITTFYATTSGLTLQTNGPGSISANFKGTNLIVDRSYTVRATPAKGQLFSGWSGSVTATANPLTFVMQSNMVVQAKFVANAFIAAAGTYEGLFFNPGAMGEQSSGLLSSLRLQNSGAYSGVIVAKGIHYGFTGSFDVAEQQSTPTVGRPDTQGGPLALNITLGVNQITGTVSGSDEGGWTSALLAEQISPLAGSAEYTMIIRPSAGAPTESPPGYGYALITNHNGTFTLTGAVADGAAFSQNVSVVGGGDVPFYASLYGNTGLLVGWLNLDGGLTATNLWWIKTPSSISALYTNGFTNIIMNALTSTWTKPAANYLSSNSLTILSTNLSLNFDVSITNTILLKEPGSPTNSLTGIFYPKTGLLKVTFGNGPGKATTIGYTAILGDSTNGDGYFVTKTNAGAITLSPGLNPNL